MSTDSWNTDLIKRQLENAKKIVASNPSSIFQTDIVLLESLLDDNISLFAQSDIFRERMNDNMEACLTHSEFLRDIGSFASLGDMLPNCDTLEYTEFNYRDGLPFSIAHDFFSQLGKEYRSLFNKVFKERRDNILVSSSRSYNVFLPGTKYSYINVERNDIISDFFNIIHEYGHTVSDLIKYRDPEYDKYPFIELLPLFLEMPAADYFQDALSGVDDEVQIYRVNDAKQMVNYSTDIRDLSTFFFNVEDMRILSSRRKTRKAISRALEIPKRQAQKMLNTSLVEKFAYTIPYLTAIELYYVFLEDPEYALNLIKTILTLPNSEDYNAELRKIGINLNEHSKEYILRIR